MLYLVLRKAAEEEEEEEEKEAEEELVEVLDLKKDKEVSLLTIKQDRCLLFHLEEAEDVAEL
jgi:hypothetical protein